MITFANGLVADRDVGMGPTPQGSEEDKAKKREREHPGRNCARHGSTAAAPGLRCRFCGPVATGPSYGLHVGPAVLLRF